MPAPSRMDRRSYSSFHPTIRSANSAQVTQTITSTVERAIFAERTYACYQQRIRRELNVIEGFGASEWTILAVRVGFEPFHQISSLQLVASSLPRPPHPPRLP